MVSVEVKAVIFDICSNWGYEQFRKKIVDLQDEKGYPLLLQTAPFVGMGFFPNELDDLEDELRRVKVQLEQRGLKEDIMVVENLEKAVERAKKYKCAIRFT